MPKYGYTSHKLLISLIWNTVGFILLTRWTQLSCHIASVTRQDGESMVGNHTPFVIHLYFTKHASYTAGQHLYLFPCHAISGYFFSWLTMYMRSQRSYEERTVNTLHITHLMWFTQSMKNMFLLTLFNWRVPWICNRLIQYNIMQMYLYNYFKICSNRVKIS